jgi:hypothetical protein
LSSETGQLIRLQVPTRERVIWLGPAWAVVCGIVASSAFTWNGRDILIAALAVLLADGVWATVWWSLVETDWANSFGRWAQIDNRDQIKPLPFSQPGSPADRAQRWFTRFLDWWRSVLWPEAGTAVLSVIVASGLGLALSAVIGWPALALSLAAFALIQISLIVRRRLGRLPLALHALLDIGLAWTLGHAAWGDLSLLSLGMAIIFSIAYAGALNLLHGGSSTRRWLLAQLLAIGLLVALQEPLAAFALSVVVAAQALLASVLRGRSFARATQFWLMAAMLIAALAIR